jgi:hypothetical protein
MGATIAAIIIRKEEEVVSQFRSQSAISPESAQTLETLGVRGDHSLTRLRRSAVIREAAHDRFYLDDARWDAKTQTRRRSGLIVLIAVVLTMFVGYMVTRVF